MDRLSRNQADIAGLYERMSFAEIKIVTVADGAISELHVGLKGTMSALFLKALAAKTHRGLSGRVRAGKSAGGRAYGYDPVPGQTGELAINAAEAAIVRRIYADTIAGAPVREIAARLNAEGIAGPRGGRWNASTITGSRKRGNGILRNELYAGRIVWNRQRFVKDPDTGKRISRLNNTADRLITETPALRILDDVTWNAAQAVMSGRGRSYATQARRRRHIFSGLCKCGSCGGSYVASGGGARGKGLRLRCSTRHEKGTCDNSRTIAVGLLEDRMLEALDRHLLHEDVVAAAAEEYIAERKRLAKDASAERLRHERRLGEIKRAQQRLIDATMKAGMSDAMAAQMKELEAERLELTRTKAPAAEIVTIHPAAGERFRLLVADLRGSLSSAGEPEARAAAIEKVRQLVEEIVIYPRDDAAGRDLELAGTLAALLGVSEQGRMVVGKVVAGTGFEPVTFRL